MRTIFTMADYPELVAVLMVNPADDPTNPDTLVRAPCCGHVTIAAAVADVRGIPGTVVKGGGIRPPRDHNWLCGDACLPRLYADESNAWTESALLKERGAPIQMVHWHRAQEWLQEMRLQAGKRQETIEPDVLYGIAVEQIELAHRRKAEEAATSMLDAAGVAIPSTLVPVDPANVKAQRI